MSLDNVVRSVTGRLSLREPQAESLRTLGCSTKVVLSRLADRGDNSWTEAEVDAFALAEADHAASICASLAVPLIALHAPTLDEFVSMLAKLPARDERRIAPQQGYGPAATEGQSSMTRNPFAGAWRIVWMSAWDQDYVDMDGPGHITFGRGRSGSFQFGMVQGQMDCGPAEPQRDRIEFTWHGFDEGTEHTGRGHARIVGGELQGHLYFHLGDDSAFRAVRQPTSARECKTAR